MESRQSRYLKASHKYHFTPNAALWSRFCGSGNEIGHAQQKSRNIQDGVIKPAYGSFSYCLLGVWGSKVREYWQWA
jgi:hypothetical protein